VVNQLAHTPQLTLVAAGEKGELAGIRIPGCFGFRMPMPPIAAPNPDIENLGLKNLVFFNC
jgi:hypothetical protein